MTDDRARNAQRDGQPPHPRLDQFCEFVLIGQGGFGEVWRATDPRLNRQVAFKILKPSARHTHQVLDDLLHEAQIAAKFQLQHVVQVHHVDLEVPCIQMEYVQGCSLWHWVRNECGTPLPHLYALWLMCPVVEAVQKLHDAGVTHRDIKPANIMLAIEEGYPLVAKLCDFGTSRGSSTASDGDNQGSYDFAAPERIDRWIVQSSPAFGNQQQADCAGDQYSLAASLFFAVTGVSHRLAPALIDDLPEAWREPLGRTLHHHPAARFESVGHLARKLRKLLDDQTASHLESAWQALQSGQVGDARNLLDVMPPPLQDPTLSQQIHDRWQSALQTRIDELQPRLVQVLEERDWESVLAYADALIPLYAERDGASEEYEQLVALRRGVAGDS